MAIGCLSVVGLGLIAAIVGYVLVKLPPPPPPEAAYGQGTTGGHGTATSPATGGSLGAGSSGTASSGASGPASGSQGSAAAAQAPPLEAQIHQVETASRSPQPVQVQIIITQDALNDLVAQHLTGDVHDLQVYFGDNTVVSTGTVDWRGQKVYLTARGHPLVSNGDVDVVLDSIQLGRLPAPAQFYDVASSRINRSLDELLAHQHFRAESVEVTPGAMTVTGVAGGQS